MPSALSGQGQRWNRAPVGIALLQSATLQSATVTSRLSLTLKFVASISGRASSSSLPQFERCHHRERVGRGAGLNPVTDTEILLDGVPVNVKVFHAARFQF